MKYVLLIVAFLITQETLAEEHTRHPKHNMVLFGEAEVFASHIVYKVPHNFQVILKVVFDPATLETYLRARQQFPSSQFIYLLDSSDISKIDSLDQITGAILYEDAAGVRHTILSGIQVFKKNFQIVFFDEVPLDLNAKLK